MYSTIYNKDKATCRVVAEGEAWSAFHIRRSTFDVERSMFDVQIVASEITMKPSYHIEITYTG